VTDAVVIGAGPAGLMAAEVMARAGLSVCVADAMTSVGRKFLMAGKSGLNLTKDEAPSAFSAAYGNVPELMRNIIAEFGPAAVQDWAKGLGQPLFTGSTGRVFPKVMKASPLLRAWLARLQDLGVVLQNRWHWDGWDDDTLMFTTPDGPLSLRPKVTVLALGGASWARLGSDGKWRRHLAAQTAPFAPANGGFAVNWSAHMAPLFGKPVKSVCLKAGHQVSRGEFVITRNGIEGGGIYQISAVLRGGAAPTIDLRPDWSLERVKAALARKRPKDTLRNHLRKALRLDPTHIALLYEFGQPFPDGMAEVIKALPIALKGPLPLDEAISTAGGIRFDALDDGLMLRHRPGVFCAGEMLDWEAPTGGYLITGCLATGRHAGLAAAAYANA